MTEHNAPSPGKRPVGPALWLGMRRTCPRCGEGKMFNGYLSVRDSCDVCEQEFHHHRADDMHPWITILIVGHIIGPLMLYGATSWTLPDSVHMVMWPSLAAALCLLILPFAKGFVIALQWAHRMHGFASGD